jgi:hypothetical protein
MATQSRQKMIPLRRTDIPTKPITGNRAVAKTAESGREDCPSSLGNVITFMVTVRMVFAGRVTVSEEKKQLAPTGSPAHFRRIFTGSSLLANVRPMLAARPPSIASEEGECDIANFFCLEPTVTV